PTNVKHFLPEFSTLNQGARLAHSAAFLDLVSPYYDYGMMMCGIPKVRVLGTGADWKLMADSIVELKKVLSKADKYLSSCLDGVETILKNLNSEEFWKEMFYTERCGSGSQYLMQGWINKFYVKDNNLNTL